MSQPSSHQLNCYESAKGHRTQRNAFTQDIFNLEPQQVVCFNPDYAMYELEMGTTDIIFTDFASEFKSHFAATREQANASSRIQPATSSAAKLFPKEKYKDASITKSEPRKLGQKQPQSIRDTSNALPEPEPIGGLKLSRPLGARSSATTIRATNRIHLSTPHKNTLSDATRALFDDGSDIGSPTNLPKTNLEASTGIASRDKTNLTTRLTTRLRERITPMDPHDNSNRELKVLAGVKTKDAFPVAAPKQRPNAEFSKHSDIASTRPHGYTASKAAARYSSGLTKASESADGNEQTSTKTASQQGVQEVDLLDEILSQTIRR